MVAPSLPCVKRRKLLPAHACSAKESLDRTFYRAGDTRMPAPFVRRHETAGSPAG